MPERRRDGRHNEQDEQDQAAGGGEPSGRHRSPDGGPDGAWEEGAARDGRGARDEHARGDGDEDGVWEEDGLVDEAAGDEGDAWDDDPQDDDRDAWGGDPADDGDAWGDEEPPAGDAPVDFDTFCDWADEIVTGIPERLLDELTGGIQIDRAARRHPDDPPDVFLLGEYITEPYLGRFIRIYYGSFAKTFAGDPPEVWYDELEETILHELRHHIEALAGVDWLGLEDLRHLQELWEEARRGEARPGHGERPEPE